MKSFNDPGTIGELMVQLEAYEYSKEYMEIMKESFELQIMEKMVEGRNYIQESGQLNHTIAGCLYSESVNVDTGFIVMLESKQEGLLKFVWTKIKEFFIWVANALSKLFLGKELSKINASNIDFGDNDLAEELKSAFEQLESGLVTRNSPGKEKTFKVSRKDALVNPRLIIKNALKFVNEGQVEISTFKHTSASNMEQISKRFEFLAKAVDNLPDRPERVVEACEAIVKLCAESGETVTVTKERVNIADMKAAADVVKNSSKIMYDVKPNQNIKKVKDADDMGTGVSTDIGKAVEALNQMNIAFNKTANDTIKANNAVIAAQKKMHATLTKYADKHPQGNPKEEKQA